MFVKLYGNKNETEQWQWTAHLHHEITLVGRMSGRYEVAVCVGLPTRVFSYRHGLSLIAVKLHKE